MNHITISTYRSAIASPTMNINIEARNHDHTIPAGPAGIEYANVLAIDGSSPMIEKAMPKTSIMVKFRRSSCLYPSLAGRLVSMLGYFLDSNAIPSIAASSSLERPAATAVCEARRPPLLPSGELSDILIEHRSLFQSEIRARDLRIYAKKWKRSHRKHKKSIYSTQDILEIPIVTSGLSA